MKSLKPNNLGKKYLVEQIQKVRISDYLKGAKGQLKQLIISSEIEADGFKIDLITSKTNYQGERYWFKCPICGQRAGILYKHPQTGNLGCRKCLNLEYRSRRYKGMIENLMK